VKYSGISDTSSEAREILDEGYRRMTPPQKLQRVVAEPAAEKARIRAQYGEIPEEEMRMRLGAPPRPGDDDQGLRLGSRGEGLVSRAGGDRRGRVSVA
jgi:hypothetical protein